MKKPITSVHLGNPILEPSELHFLQRLRADLERRGMPALILANFLAGRHLRQIDFLIVRPDRVVHCEQKTYKLPVIGPVNGPWRQMNPDGTERGLGGENPFRQAQDGTYGISNDIAALVRRDRAIPGDPAAPFFKNIDTVICTYPAVPAGSKLNRYSYVDVVDYNQLLERLNKPGPRLPWGPEHWEAFIRDRNLYRLDERSTEERAREVDRAVLADYRRRFIATHEAELHELVPVSAKVAGASETEMDLVGLALSNPTVLVSGASGLGKSHAAHHAGIRLAREGHLPVWLRCGEYEAGQLDVLLGRAVASFTTETASTLFQPAHEAGSVVVLILDGFNECPPKLRGELIEETAALCLAAPLHVVITTQMAPSLPENMAAVEVILLPPVDAERTALVRSYGGTGGMDVFTSFTTPFELSIAAECAQELSPNAPRAELLDAVVRRRSSGEGVRSGLRVLANLMDAELRTSVPLALAVQTLQRARVTPAVIDLVLASPLLDVHPARVGFTHELLGRFLVAEELVLRATNGVQLGRFLNEPRHADIREDALVLERDRDRLRATLRELADVDLLHRALGGDLGEMVQAVATAEAEALLAEAAYAVTEDSTTFIVGTGLFDDSWKLERPWSGFEQALLAAVGRSLHEGLFAEPVIHLLDQTDDMLVSCAKTLRGAGEKLAITRVASSVCGGIVGRDDALAAGLVITAIDPLHTYRPGLGRKNRQAEVCAAVFRNAQPNAWSRLYTALLLFDPVDVGNAAILPALVTAAWDAGGYHLRLQALWTAERAAHRLPEAHRPAVVEVLQGISTDNLGLSTTLLDALAAYGAITPILSLEEIREELRKALARGEQPDAWEEARKVVLYQLEEEGVVGPYSEAIAELSEEERSGLFLMALRAPDAVSLFGTHFVLDELLRHADIDDVRIQAVLRDLASQLALGSHDVQHMLACHFDALATCSRFCEEPPPLASSDDNPQALEAWHALRTVLFFGVRGATSVPSVEAAWQRLHEDFPEIGVDVLYQLWHAGIVQWDEEKRSHATVLTRYPAQLRRLLEWGLRNRDRLAASVRYSDPKRRAEYIVRTLRWVGDEHTAVLLRGYAEDPELGPLAVEAVRALEGLAAPAAG